MHPLVVLSYLRPRFAYILGHYGHAPNRRRDSARRGEALLYYVHKTNTRYIYGICEFDRCMYGSTYVVDTTAYHRAEVVTIADHHAEVVTIAVEPTLEPPGLAPALIA